MARIEGFGWMTESDVWADMNVWPGEWKLVYAGRCDTDALVVAIRGRRVIWNWGFAWDPATVDIRRVLNHLFVPEACKKELVKVTGDWE